MLSSKLEERIEYHKNERSLSNPVLSQSQNIKEKSVIFPNETTHYQG